MAEREELSKLEELARNISDSEEDSDDVPDTEIFGPSVENDADEKAEPEKVKEEHRPSLLKTFVKVKKKQRRLAKTNQVLSCNFKTCIPFKGFGCISYDLRNISCDVRRRGRVLLSLY